MNLFHFLSTTKNRILCYCANALLCLLLLISKKCDCAVDCPRVLLLYSWTFVNRVCLCIVPGLMPMWPQLYFSYLKIVKLEDLDRKIIMCMISLINDVSYWVSFWLFHRMDVGSVTFIMLTGGGSSLVDHSGKSQ